MFTFRPCLAGNPMSQIQHFRHFTCFAAALTAPLIAAPAQAQGDLLVAPTRVILNNGGNAELVLSNIGTTEATYRIGIELRRMTDDGDFEEVTEANANATEQAAAAMIRYAPRRITLLPGQPQSVRLSARPGPEVPDGEYRVHMSFRAIPPALTPEQAQKDAAAGGLSIRLTPVYGITIPVFIRKGQLQAGAALANPHLVKSGNDTLLDLTINRTGNRSVYGELIGKGPRGEVLFNMRGVAVYPEVQHRSVRIPLTAEQQAKLTGAPVKIEYREMPENGGQLIADLTAQIR